MNVAIGAVPYLFPLIEQSLDGTAEGSSHVQLDVKEVSGHPPMIYGVPGVSITFHMPGVTKAQVEQVLNGEVPPNKMWKLATGGFFRQVNKMREGGTF